MENKNKQILEVIETLDKKDFGIYFFVLDTMGNPTAGIANIYENVKILNELGYNACILHEKNEYKGVESWLGAEYMALPHISIESQKLNVKSADFIIIPEIFSTIMEQVKGFPCKKVVFSQSYNYIFELLPIGKRWNYDYGFNDVITTSEKQAEYIKSMFPNINTHVIPVSISDDFKDTDKIKKPIVAIHTRDQSDALKIVKSFYLQNPTYKWVTFRDMRGLDRKTFADDLANSCLAVWVDDVAGFGTFGLEAIECNTPVIGKIPNMVPEWMEESVEGDSIKMRDNGIWTNSNLSIPELIAIYIKLWLDDAVPVKLLEGMEASKGQYTREKQVSKVTEVFETLVTNRKAEFTAMLVEEEKTIEDEK